MDRDTISVEDAVQVFGLSPDFSLTDLKNRYRDVARRVHPDKGGSPELFNTVNECYKVLCLEHRARTGFARHDQLKMEFDADVSRYDSAGRRVAENFSIAQFNEVFEKTKVADEVYGSGYGDWLTSEEDFVSESKAPKLNPKCGTDAFNRAFERAAPPPKEERSLIVRPLDANCGSSLALTELGGESTSDFSFDGGYDCRLAHSSRRLAGNARARPSYSSTTPGRIEAEREADMARGLSDAELAALASQQDKEKQIDEARRQVEMTRHYRRAEAHASANRMFLTN